MAGRFGQYITDGTTNATVPKTEDGMTISLEDAAALIDARAAMPPKRGQEAGEEGGGEEAGAKKPAAKKAGGKKAGVRPTMTRIPIV